MQTKLQKYFPMLRSREEILREIDENVKLTEQFYSWREAQRQEFLDFCTGVRGIKMLYDSFFKEVMNPETVPERLEEFLGILLNQKVKIIEILPGDSTRIADEQSLLIMDILVRFEDGTYCNVEVQKIGYAFPGERSACYSSDLLLRQYKKARSVKKDHFTYKDVKGVYTIVLMEKSPAVFQKYPDEYIHIFIPLDIFKKNVENKGIKNKMDGWLTFLGMDDAEKIIELINTYPEFREMYEHVYYICRNVEDVMGIFSEELRIMDRNTVRYMVDEMQETIDEQKETIDEQKETIDEQKEMLAERDRKLEENICEMQEMQESIEELKKQIELLQK